MEGDKGICYECGAEGQEYSKRVQSGAKRRVFRCKGNPSHTFYTWNSQFKLSLHPDYIKTKSV